jgi:preprotein translocase subunit SecG
MLSFLKEKIGGDSPMNRNGGAQSNSEDDQNFLEPAEHGKNLKQSTMMLGILLAVGAICLWFMIKKAAPETTNAAVNTQEIEIEKAIAQITGIRSQVDSQVDDIVDRFYNPSDISQVQVSDLKKNPFKHDLSIGTIETDEDDQGVAMELFREELKNKARKLQLYSIMESEKGGCCMINDEILYVGDTILGFTVTGISNDWVELTVDTVKIKLKMEE